jgi:hypothetical protein
MIVVFETQALLNNNEDGFEVKEKEFSTLSPNLDPSCRKATFFQPSKTMTSLSVNRISATAGNPCSGEVGPCRPVQNGAQVT